MLLPSPTLAASTWVVTVLAIFFAFTCALMMLVILIQKPKGGGLSGAFGGAGGGSSEAAFGAKVGDVLTWITVGCFVAFLLLAMGLTWAIDPAVATPQQPKPATSQTTSPGTSPQGAEGETPKNQASADQAETSDASEQPPETSTPATDSGKSANKSANEAVNEKANPSTRDNAGKAETPSQRPGDASQ